MLPFRNAEWRCRGPIAGLCGLFHACVNSIIGLLLVCFRDVRKVDNGP